jgi:hypothetical protein
MICQEAKRPGRLAGEGDPAWRYRAGQPAQVAVAKCPKATRENKGKFREEKQDGNNDKEIQL